VVNIVGLLLGILNHRIPSWQDALFGRLHSTNCRLPGEIRRLNVAEVVRCVVSQVKPLVGCSEAELFQDPSCGG